MNVLDQLRDKIENAEPAEFVEVLFDFMKDKGQSKYDESVTQIEHGLQCAQLARKAGLDQAGVTAGLLHDIGHLLVDEHDAQNNFLAADLNHEEVGAQLLRDWFPPSVTEPIRLHVAAKRYLCTTDDNYYNCLSDASKRSFQLQGGNLSDEEVAEFQQNEFLDTALKIRRFDDLAKVEGKDVPPIEEFADAVADSLITR